MNSVRKSIHEWLTRQGFTYVPEKSRNHAVYTDGDRVTITTSKTPSCPYALKHVQGDVKRARLRFYGKA